MHAGQIEYVLLLFSVTVFTYLCAILIANCSRSNNKKLLLVICIIVNLGFLLFFKYLNFISLSLQNLLNYARVMANMPVFDIISFPLVFLFICFAHLAISLRYIAVVCQQSVILADLRYMFHFSHPFWQAPLTARHSLFRKYIKRILLMPIVPFPACS